MQTLPKSQLLRFVEEAFHRAERAVSRYSSNYSIQRYTLHQHIVLLCLKVRKNTTYRTLLDDRIEMLRIRNAINPPNSLRRQYCAKRSIDLIWRSGGCFSTSLFHCS